MKYYVKGKQPIFCVLFWIIPFTLQHLGEETDTCPVWEENSDTLIIATPWFEQKFSSHIKKCKKCGTLYIIT